VSTAIRLPRSCKAGREVEATPWLSIDPQPASISPTINISIVFICASLADHGQIMCRLAIKNDSSAILRSGKHALNVNTTGSVNTAAFLCQMLSLVVYRLFLQRENPSRRAVVLYDKQPYKILQEATTAPQPQYSCTSPDCLGSLFRRFLRCWSRLPLPSRRPRDTRSCRRSYRQLLVSHCGCNVAHRVAANPARSLSLDTDFCGRSSLFRSARQSQNDMNRRTTRTTFLNRALPIEKGARDCLEGWLGALKVNTRSRRCRAGQRTITSESWEFG